MGNIQKKKTIIVIIISILTIVLASIGVWFSIEIPIQINVNLQGHGKDLTDFYYGTIQVDDKIQFKINDLQGAIWGWTQDFNFKTWKGTHRFTVTNIDTGKQDSTQYYILDKKFILISIDNENVSFQLRNNPPIYL